MSESADDGTISYQLPAAFRDLFRPMRYKVFYGGRGGAKSWAFALALLLIGMMRTIRVLCARELQVSINDSVYKLLSDMIEKSPVMSRFYEVQGKGIFGKNGTEFSFRGLRHNYNEIKSFEGVDYVWVEEAQAVSEKSWETLIPTIRKEGSEIWLSFNPKNATDPTYERFIMRKRDNAIVKKVGWRDNPFFPKVLDDERRDLMETDPEAYAHIWEGELDTRYSGAVYAKWVAALQEQGRISDRVVHDPNFPVYTAWDLGYDDATAIVFYQLGKNEVFIIDYFEDNLEDIRHYAEVCYGREIKVKERNMDTGEVLNWEFGRELSEHKHRQSYIYHADFAPHDAASKLQAAGGISILAQAHNFKMPMVSIPATSGGNNREALRTVLPKCWINATRCKGLVAAFMQYHFPYDEDKKVFKKDPAHDWSSHGCDAAELMAQVWHEKSAPTMKQLEKQQRMKNFKRLRSQFGQTDEDPYRLRHKRRK